MDNLFLIYFAWTLTWTECPCSDNGNEHEHGEHREHRSGHSLKQSNHSG